MIKKYGYSTRERIEELVKNGKIRDQLVASHMIRVSRHLERINIFLSSNNLSLETCRQINLGYIKPEEVSKVQFSHVVYNPVDVTLQKI